jgi:GTP pyrophosphokinase
MNMKPIENKAYFDGLETEYNSLYSLALKFSEELRKQLIELLEQNEISLAFPIESRVKSWNSLSGKVEAKSVSIENIKDMYDFVGLRIILLFRRDLLNVCRILGSNFNVIEHEDTQMRLRENEFGYLSFHYIIELPETWLAIPTFSLFKDFKAEIQVRTAAQHIWASASHKLQYKKESNVPVSIRRSINRVSAILEIVDLEIERVLIERSEYIKDVDIKEESIGLNVDLLKQIIDSYMPKENWKENEPYAELLEDLLHFGIDNSSKLISLLEKRLDDGLRLDLERVEDFRAHPDPSMASPERIAKGVFYTQVGLIRRMLSLEFPDLWKTYGPAVSLRRKGIKSKLPRISVEKPSEGP